MHRDTLKKHLEPFLKYRYVIMEEKNGEKKYFLNPTRRKFFDRLKSGPDLDEMIEKLTESFEKPMSGQKISNDQLKIAHNVIQDTLERQVAISFITNSDTFDDLVKKLAKNEFRKYSKIIELIFSLIKKEDPDALYKYQFHFLKKITKDEKRISKNWEEFQKVFISRFSN